MKIYVGHSSSIDFKNNLYQPLRKNGLNDEHDLVFPHEDSGELFDSKSFLRNEADLMIAEVSQASTGLGIELGWADVFGVSVICVCREESHYSSSVNAITDTILKYGSKDEMTKLLKEEI